MTWLLMLPNWIKVAIVGAVVVGVLQVRCWWEVRGLNDRIERLEVALALEKGATADLRVALSDVQGNRDKLVATIEDQNASIELMKVEARRAEVAADLRVARATALAKEAARDLRAPTTRVAPGHAAMNQWLQERFVR